MGSAEFIGSCPGRIAFGSSTSKIRRIERMSSDLQAIRRSATSTKCYRIFNFEDPPRGETAVRIFNLKTPRQQIISTSITSEAITRTITIISNQVNITSISAPNSPIGTPSLQGKFSFTNELLRFSKRKDLEAEAITDLPKERSGSTRRGVRPESSKGKIWRLKKWSRIFQRKDLEDRKEVVPNLPKERSGNLMGFCMKV
jgi:hypothetical protein